MVAWSPTPSVVASIARFASSYRLLHVENVIYGREHASTRVSEQTSRRDQTYTCTR